MNTRRIAELFIALVEMLRKSWRQIYEATGMQLQPIMQGWKKILKSLTKSAFCAMK